MENINEEGKEEMRKAVIDKLIVKTGEMLDLMFRELLMEREVKRECLEVSIGSEYHLQLPLRIEAFDIAVAFLDMAKRQLKLEMEKEAEKQC
jgi:hypothetical protein